MPAFYQSTPVVSSVSVNINENRNNMVRTAPVHTAAKVGTGTRYSASISAQAKTRGAEVRRQPYTAAVTSSNRVINKPVNGRVNTGESTFTPASVITAEAASLIKCKQKQRISGFSR